MLIYLSWYFSNFFCIPINLFKQFLFYYVEYVIGQKNKKINWEESESKNTLNTFPGWNQEEVEGRNPEGSSEPRLQEDIQGGIPDILIDV